MVAHEDLKTNREQELTCDRTYIAFDNKKAAEFVGAMKRLGVNVGTCGVQTVRLRPMLIFDEAHGMYLIHENRH
jgi:4-aminobutyrate aminotransferase-like enzyme